MNRLEKEQEVHNNGRELYDKHIHSVPFEADDLVWLHNPSVQRGECKKFHRSWLGPYKVMKRLSESTYRIKSIHNSRKRVVVHFDRLKKCAGDMRLQSKYALLSHLLLTVIPHQPQTTIQQRKEMDDPGPGEHLHEMQPVDMPAGNQAGHLPNHKVQVHHEEQAPRRYPFRVRKPPDRY